MVARAGTEIMKFVSQLRVHESGTFSDAFGGRFMVIQDDQVDSHFLEKRCLFSRIGPAIRGDQQGGRVVVEAVFDPFHAESVSLFHPGREKAAGLKSVGGEEMPEQRNRTDAIDIVVAIEHDRFPVIDRLKDSLYRTGNTGEAEGIS